MSSRADAILRKSRACLLGAMLLAVFPAARADELSDAQAAEKAGQYARALQLYTAALEKAPEGTPEELDLFRRAIGAASKVRPAPAPPAATVRFEGRAEAAAKGAQSPADFAMAAGEFRKAARAAPWVAAYHFNMGVTLEKAGQFAAAKDAFETYLLAAPAAPDARDVAKRIAGLEFQMEQAGRAQPSGATTAKPAAFDIASIAGQWRAAVLTGPKAQKPMRASEWSHEDLQYRSMTSQVSTHAQVSVSNTSVRIIVAPPMGGDLATEFDGQYTNGQLSGVATIAGKPELCGPAKQRVPFTAEIDPAAPYIVLAVLGRFDPLSCRPKEWYLGSYLLFR